MNGGMNVKITSSTILFICLTIIGPLVADFSHAKIDKKSIVAVWLLDEGKGTIAMDSSGNGFDGTITGALKWDKGKFGFAVNFLAGEKIEVPDNESMNFETKSFSVVTWINFKNPQDWNRIVRERNPSPWTSGNAGWELQTEGISIHWSLDDKQGNHQRNTYPGVGDGQWHHTAMIVDRGRKSLISYLDGENERTVNIANIGSVTTELPVVIGGGFNGLVDEVAIFNTVISGEDVALIMNKGLAEVLKVGSAVQPLEKCATFWGYIKEIE